MAELEQAHFTAAPYNARRQFGIGIALVSVIPILVFLYLVFVEPSGKGGILNPCFIPLYIMVVVLAVIGYMLLRAHPQKITELRTDMEQILGRQLLQSGQPATAKNDIAAIEQYMDMIADKLKGGVQEVTNEKQRLETQLVQVRKIESLSIMASGLSHDFNNLLAAIVGNACILLRNLPPDSPVKENARQIESTTLRAIELANLIHIYSGKGKLIEEDMDITGLVRELGDLMKSAAAKNVDIEYHLDDNVPKIVGDATQVRQVIMNLFANAAESIENGEGRVVITTGTMDCTREYLKSAYLDENLREGKYVFLEVSDNGCGITDEVKARMFDPFYTAKIRGRGLGLSVVLGVVRSHDGAIKIDSVPGKGSTFRALFPAVVPREAAKSSVN
jgi:signal transduction histidine kinase